ncbi:MAG: VWA domain-containing protein [Deltaproteobacteria bacterium]|jgi:uncharacterized protein YegL|nr:VWA domain-containing protein [Deltaproteobacteria bacterium]
MRKLPVYLLIDVSGSMYGEPIESVKNGIKTLHTALRKEPQAMEMAFLSVITFESNVRQLIPLTEISKFRPPDLEASGGTSLGGALTELVRCAKNEVATSTPDRKGDYKPMVFIMTDGEPTDDVDAALPAFQAYKWGIVVACAAGHDANVGVLQKIAGPNVLMLDVADSNSISAFFKFVTTSIATTSKKVDAGGQEGGMNDLPPPPPEISLFKS